MTNRTPGVRLQYRAVTSADHRRRRRRIALLLSAILIPAAAVILLVFRVVWQENELVERRATEQRRDALDQLRRELSARLQALRLGEVNRLIGETARRLPSDSPIVFVAPMVQDRGHERIVPPWEQNQSAPRPGVAFARAQREGESQEFQHNDPGAAVASYGRALDLARTTWEACTARVALGRSYAKAGRTDDAERSDLVALKECGPELDADGVPFALYAAERLLAGGRSVDAVSEFLVRRVSVRQPQWRSPNETLMLESLVRRLTSPAATEALTTVEAEIHTAEQIAALVTDTDAPLARLQRASRPAPGDLPWMAYGDEPWLLTLVSPASFATPLVMAVSSRQIVPDDVTLRASPAPGTVPFGDGFVDLHVGWAPGRFADQSLRRGSLLGSMLFVVIGTALLAGYLLIRDVHREAETSALRSHFVASVSHELKTPLTSIRAHAETLMMGRATTPETTSDYLRTIVSESERLTRLVDSVLDFSRIEQGRKAYQLQQTSLDDVVRSAAKTMEHALLQLGFTLAISTDGTAPIVQADREALTHAILNLLGNAMKYSGDARRIEIRTGTRHAEAFVDVVDHGIGIARDDQARIFERFQRVQSPETAGVAGTGLGLTLALHVVEAHRGRIAVVSQPGQGSTFSVRIPLQAPA
jgi:signal transduction histidine kinase